MSGLIMNHFNVLDYVEEAEKLGMSDELAKFQARKMEALYTTTIDEVRKELKDEHSKLKDEHKGLKEELLSKEFATRQDLQQVKLDLQREIKESKLELQKEMVQSTNKIIFWVAGLLVATGLIQHFFK